jgi:hypothetical protein
VGGIKLGQARVRNGVLTEKIVEELEWYSVVIYEDIIFLILHPSYLIDTFLVGNIDCHVFEAVADHGNVIPLPRGWHGFLAITGPGGLAKHLHFLWLVVAKHRPSKLPVAIH